MSLHKIVELIFVVTFMVEGAMRCLIQSQRDFEIWHFSYKAQQIETMIVNSEWLKLFYSSIFQFEKMRSTFPYLITIIGIVQVAAIGVFFFIPAEVVRARLDCVKVIMCLLILEMLFTHNPFSELENKKGQEWAFVYTNIALIGGLYIFAGGKYIQERNKVD